MENDLFWWKLKKRTMTPCGDVGNIWQFLDLCINFFVIRAFDAWNEFFGIFIDSFE